MHNKPQFVIHLASQQTHFCLRRKLSNQIKNRYSDVLCLDQSRVRLCKLCDDDDEVMINTCQFCHS